MAQTLSGPLIALESFCTTCPPVREVTAQLAQLGFRLTWQMDAMPGDSWGNMPSLPAQYHYQDKQGTQVTYLAGKDSPSLEGAEAVFPPHESRWWIDPGLNRCAYEHVVHTLASRWSLTWQPSMNH